MSVAEAGGWRSRTPPPATVVAVVVFYAAGSLMAWHSFGADVGLAFFPPAGVTTAALILSDRRHWPMLLVAVFATEVSVDLLQGLGLGYAIGYGVANSLEPLAAVLVFGRLNPARVPFDQRRGKLSYIVGASGVGALAGALIGATVVSQQRPETRWLTNVVHWWAGDGLAILAIGGSVVLVATTTFSRRQRTELVVGAIVTGVATFVALNVVIPPAAVILPLLTVAAFRVGPAGATVAGSAFALVANYVTHAGHGYFADLDTSPTSQLALLQVFIAVLVIVGWSIGVEVLARVDAVKASARFEYQRDEATAAVRAIHRAVGPRKAHRAGPFIVGSCYRQSNVTGLVGGDWFDAFELPKGRLMFVVGDVVGHGVDAMEDMAQLRLASRAFASEGHGPSRILAELNVFTKNSTLGRFATMIVAVYDPTEHSLTLASAGHPPPLRRRSGTNQYIPITPGAPLGVADDGLVGETILELHAGDLFVLYTDGVIERRGRSLDDGLQQLSSALECVDTGVGPDDMCRHLIECCFADVEAEDDRCVLIVELDGL